MSGLLLPRRQLLLGLGALIAAPAIVRVDSLMKLPPRIIVPAKKKFLVTVGISMAPGFTGAVYMWSDVPMDVGATFTSNGIGVGPVLAVSEVEVTVA